MTKDFDPNDFDPDYIPEFTLDHVNGMWVATRKNSLSAYQRGHGCHRVVTATTVRELNFVCMAERIKADLVAAAESEFREAHAAEQRAWQAGE